MLCGLSLRRLIAQVFPRLAEVGEQKVIDGRQEPAAILVARYQDPEGLRRLVVKRRQPLGLVEGGALGMTIAPVVRIDVPDSDNCGYPAGMIVQAKQGTVEVRRPAGPNLILEIFGALLKAAH